MSHGFRFAAVRLRRTARLFLYSVQQMSPPRFPDSMGMQPDSGYQSAQNINYKAVKSVCMCSAHTRLFVCVWGSV